jgi:hypothetical protein
MRSGAARAVWGATMADLSYLKYLKTENLTDAERKELDKHLRSHRRAIQAALKLVDNHLRRLAKPPSKGRKKK